ncbi:CpsD/CapB family tyrosine-protein kinase [Halobacillus faecis]
MLKRRKGLVDKNYALITNFDSHSPMVEQYRAVRTDLQIASNYKEINKIMVTSANASEGKSLTVSNLSISFAQQGKKVLLIDCDLRIPSLHYTFRLDNRMGLSNALLNNSTWPQDLHIQPSKVTGLDILPSGPIPSNPAELIGSDRMKKLLDECLKHYDLIMLDTPPLLAVTDAQILGQMCNGALLVARSKKVKVDSIQKAVELLKPCNLTYFGSVLNDVKNSQADYYSYGM